MLQIFWRRLKNNFISTSNIHIGNIGKTYNSNTWCFSSRDYFFYGWFRRELYIWSTQKIQSEYYHSDQVSIFVHVLYRHSQHNVDDIESTNDNRHVIKECHFYISDDRTHDTYYVEHCFDIIYGSLKTHRVVMNENWIW